MLYFFEQFRHKIFIIPGIFLLIWLILLTLSIFDIQLWAQGIMDFSIISLVFILFITGLLIGKTIVRSNDSYNYHWLVLPTALIVFLFAYSFVVYMQPVERNYYEENGYTVLMDKKWNDRGEGRIYFYKKTGIFAEKVAYCKIAGSSSSTCTYTIDENGYLVVEGEMNNDTGRSITYID